MNFPHVRLRLEIWIFFYLILIYYISINQIKISFNKIINRKTGLIKY